MPFEQRHGDVKRWAFALFAALSMLVAVVAAVPRLSEYGVASPFADPKDFRAFYCAGRAVVHGADPYRVEPNRSCQRALLASAGLHANVLPAPLPPYALVVFGTLARLPYRLATEVWLWANLMALAASILALAKLSRSPAALAGFSLVCAAGFVSLVFGQLVPIVLAGALCSAFGARSRNGTRAAMGATVAALEPHLALPIWLGLGLFVPVARKPLAVAAALLLTLTLLPGAALNIEYVRSVLPAHARSELMYLGSQYSLSSLLVALRVPIAQAMWTGSLCYAAMLAYGLALGIALQRRLRDAAFVVATPLAAVVLGGPFLHLQQTAVAIPLAFLVATYAPRRSAARYAAILTVVLLSVPWPVVATFFPAAPAVPVRVALPTNATRAVTPDESIETPYTASIDAIASVGERRSEAYLLAWKSPTWVALIVILVVATTLALGECRIRHTRFVLGTP